MRSAFIIQTTALRQALREYAESPAHAQERAYGEVIAATLEKMRQAGVNPDQMAPTLQEMKKYLALHPAILEGKGCICCRKK